jgi:hypothetical protein
LSTNGLAGTLVYPASTAGASASGAFTLTTLGPVVPSPAPTGTSSIYFTLQFSTTIAFQSGFVVSPVTPPASIPDDRRDLPGNHLRLNYWRDHRHSRDWNRSGTNDLVRRERRRAQCHGR